MNCPRCDTEISSHEANPCLDLWIAQAVLKWELWTEYLYSNLKNSSDPKIGCQYLISPHAVQNSGIKESSGFWDKATEIIPDTNLFLHPQKRFSLSLEDAWEVVEKMRKKHILLPIWELAFLGDFPLRVCRASLKAISNEL